MKKSLLVLLLFSLLLIFAGCQKVEKNEKSNFSFKLISLEGDDYLMDTSSCQLWIRGGILNNKIQWIKQEIPGLPENINYSEKGRFDLVNSTEKDVYIIDKKTGQLWIKGGIYNNKQLWIKQEIPGFTDNKLQ